MRDGDGLSEGHGVGDIEYGMSGRQKREDGEPGFEPGRWSVARHDRAGRRCEVKEM